MEDLQFIFVEPFIRGFYQNLKLNSNFVINYFNITFS